VCFFFGEERYFGVLANDLRDGSGPPMLKGRIGPIWSEGWGVELDTPLL